MPEYLFSYGTLQNEPIQLHLFGRVLQRSADVLRGYEIKTFEVKDKSFLSKGEKHLQLTAIPSGNSNDYIKGTALMMNNEELIITDRYEPEEYKRFKVKLESGKEAWIYLAILS